MKYLLLAMLLLMTCGCRQPSMYEQASVRDERYNDLARSGQWSRRPVPGTVAWNQVAETSSFAIGDDAHGLPLTACPLPLTPSFLERGRQRYEIFCSECHGATGYADGIIVQRGFPQPPSYHTDAMRALPLGHFVHVIAFGYGRMESYADRVPAADRWAIACWIRTLQLSQHVAAASLPADEQQRLRGIATPSATTEGPAVPADNSIPNQSGLIAPLATSSGSPTP